MQEVTQVKGPEAPKPYGYDSHGDVQFVLQQLIEICANYYHGCDFAEDAIDIAKLIICGDKADEDTATSILQNMGYLTWLGSWRTGRA
jgi:hypothetical protein